MLGFFVPGVYVSGYFVGSWAPLIWAIRYTTSANTRAVRNLPESFEFKKFDPVVRKHVMYKEAKIK